MWGALATSVVVDVAVVLVAMVLLRPVSDLSHTLTHSPVPQSLQDTTECNLFSPLLHSLCGDLGYEGPVRADLMGSNRNAGDF